MMFMMKNVVVRFIVGGAVTAKGAGSTSPSISPATRTSRAKAANQPLACRRPAKSMAPTGEVSDQRMTPLELMKPPRTSMSAPGKISVTSSWVKRKKW